MNDCNLPMVTYTMSDNTESVLLTEDDLCLGDDGSTPILRLYCCMVPVAVAACRSVLRNKKCASLVGIWFEVRIINEVG